MQPRNRSQYRSAITAAAAWDRVLQRKFGVVASTARPGWERALNRLYPARACSCADPKQAT